MPILWLLLLDPFPGNLPECMSGPGTAEARGCELWDMDLDLDVDLRDYAELQLSPQE